MTKTFLNPQSVVALLAASPEGFFKQSDLDRYTGDSDRTADVVSEAVGAGRVAQEGDYLYDPARLTSDEVRERSALYRGSFPLLKEDGTPSLRPIAERVKQRDTRLRRLKDPVLTRLVGTFGDTPGYLTVDALCTHPGDEGALMILMDMGILKRSDGLIFDPLKISRASVNELHQQQVIAPVRQQLIDLLLERPGQTAPRVDLVERFGANVLEQVLQTGDFAVFSVPLVLGESAWVRLRESDPELAREIALETVRPKDEDWQVALEQSGDVVKADAQDGQTRREKVLVRTYPLNAASNRLGVHKETLQRAISSRRVHAFVDPEGTQRVPVAEIEAIRANPERLDQIAGMENIRLRDLAIALGVSIGEVEQRMRKAGVSAHRRKTRWSQVRGRWGLPNSLPDFRTIYSRQRSDWDAARAAQRAEERRIRDEQRHAERVRRDEERRQREELRARLLAAFPTWQHAGRADQRLVLHIGPPNSGKTHEALDALCIANSGWYLAPLRLLAFEVFDRLNQRGIRCNLLTGEEFIPVQGATVTAATIEMFNPVNSGDCVVIDEAQMLADPDRGWAWTRAVMEAQAPDIHVIGPPSARTLIERLAGAAAIPMDLIQHERLAPLQVANRPWSLDQIPERTILVAFSRRTVLHLKAELEMRKRNVSVVYGNLPPEVRRRQADRFADGKTEICVATDAVGMGLNLPADRVCFFELEKFDGKQVRQLTPSEVHQIGGRAGRYGMSTVGEVSATTKRGLKVLQWLYGIPPAELTHARVAPEVEDLALIPGSLAHKFAQWAELQSIPDSLRGIIKPADIDERIALARMLTDAEVNRLGLPAAVRLVNAPTRESSRAYWRACTTAILAERPMPLPEPAPNQIENDYDLDLTEQSIACSDIYLWLSRRQEFSAYAPHENDVRELRLAWSMSIDAALMRRIDTLARCVNCRRPLPLGHRFSLCDYCYGQRGDWW
jgi:hypothetical protein